MFLMLLNFNCKINRTPINGIFNNIPVSIKLTFDIHLSSIVICLQLFNLSVSFPDNLHEFNFACCYSNLAILDAIVFLL